MKKFLVLFSLVLFIGAYSTPLNANNNKTTIIVVDEDKCPKCGKEKCDGTCEAEAKTKTKATSAKAVKAKPNCEETCESQEKTACTTKSKEKKGAEKK